MKFKLVLPILYLIMTYEFYFEQFISVVIDVKDLSGINLGFILIAGCLLRTIVWISTMLHALRNRDNENFLKKALCITKFGLIPFFVINLVFATFMGVFVTIGTRGAGTLIYIPIVMGITWSAILPGTIYGIALNRIKCNQNIMTEKTKKKLNIMQFIFVLDVFSSIITLTKYKNKNLK